MFSKSVKNQNTLKSDYSLSQNSNLEDINFNSKRHADIMRRIYSKNFAEEPE